MKIAGKEIPDLLWMEYVQVITNQLSIKCPFPPDCIYALDKKREEIHNAILDAVGEKRGSKFGNELWKEREKIYKRCLGDKK